MDQNLSNIFDKTIQAAAIGLQRKMDAHILSDFKRLVEAGILTIEHSQPKMEEFDGTIKFSSSVRVRHTAEEKIQELQKEVERLKDKLIDGQSEIGREELINENLRISLQQLKQENKELVECLIFSKEAFRDNLKMYQYKNEPLMLEAFKKIEELLTKTNKE